MEPHQVMRVMRVGDRSQMVVSERSIARPAPSQPSPSLSPPQVSQWLSSISNVTESFSLPPLCPPKTMPSVIPVEETFPHNPRSEMVTGMTLAVVSHPPAIHGLPIAHTQPKLTPMRRDRFIADTTFLQRFPTTN